jgi:hypothetical protein
MFVKDSEMVILFEKGHHDDRGKKKTNDYQEKFLLNRLVHLNLDNWIRFMFIKVEIHTLSNDLRRNL